MTVDALHAGDHVRSVKQPARGIGKVVYADSVSAVVYFKDRTKARPEDRLAESIRRLEADIDEAEILFAPAKYFDQFRFQQTDLNAFGEEVV